MKLKNKNTGVMGDLVAYDADKGIFAVKAQGGDRCYYYSLAALHEVWEDAPEEPKDFWYIDDFMIMCGTEGEFTTPDLGSFTKKDIEKLKAIGNYFKTKEEAEKAVEKLKAWKRLKDFGCGFILDDHFAVKFVGPDARKITSAEEQKSLSDAYKLLFGGEE